MVRSYQEEDITDNSMFRMKDKKITHFDPDRIISKEMAKDLG